MTATRTVILPLAGNGTRMRPATDAIAKELLPVYDTPLLHFALEEAVASGARRLVLVTRATKPGISEYVETLLSQPGSLLADIEVRFAEQAEPNGLGHAVLCARTFALPGPVGVILPDDLILGRPALAEMVAAFDPERMKCLAAAQTVDRSECQRYGIFDLATPSGRSVVLSARTLVEKPDPADAPSDLAVVGRYILSHDIWDVLERTPAGAGGEIQLTDAIAALGGLCAFRFSGRRFDCGSKEGWFSATEAYRKSRLANETVAAE
ncbi:UTP--glucose-1-phosphate uridylyltransferase [Lutimaribacter pacificus]|uniref:UTP--glucose-1-phosphate uridylyltransferase n=1 Tax=Lutimaribacter pacificus TaxID=391948 RepID=A0A1H0LU58_9RHOB|nr:sugar phosphate nucleotidyltransferase [Lutimaribacter pacificus]SDO71623.1 UTP--glucose-1-phosphate uridylyltransferase [Lutimaribacter pacificus]SHK03313.1 UTP--glucose-1-phosphate uridylyltransferase [Lutimaribacter pacificus]